MIPLLLLLLLLYLLYLLLLLVLLVLLVQLVLRLGWHVGIIRRILWSPCGICRLVACATHGCHMSPHHWGHR